MPTRPPAPKRPSWAWARSPALTTTARGYGWAWEQIKRRILARDHRCGICGYSGRADDMVDHIVPKARGGSDADSNLQRVHRACHATKTAREGRAARIMGDRRQ